MKNLDLKKIGLREMTPIEMVSVDGGKVEYFEYTWSGTDNPLIYTAEAVANGVKAVANAGIWVWNQIF